MASHNYNRSSMEAMEEYISLHTLAAGIGIFYVILSAVTFDVLSPMTVMPSHSMAFTVSPEIAGWVALAAIVAAFLASRTRDPSDYHMVEKAVVGISVLSVPAVHYTQIASDYLAEFPILLGIGGVVVAVVAFVIVVR